VGGGKEAGLESEEQEEDFPCTLWIAESSIPNAGLGTYTAIPMEKGELVASFGDPIIAHIDTTHEEIDSDYHWDESLFHFPLFDTDFPSMFMDFGATNSHPTLANLKSSFKNFKRDSAGLHRSKDPGAGAITMYNHLDWEITDNIQAGSELFVDIGTGYFEAREKKIGYVRTEGDYEIADKVLFDALELVRKEELTEEDYEVFLISTQEETSEHIRALLPSNFNDIKSAAEMGSAKFNLPNNIKTPEWLKENGWCLDDKLKYGISKISQAGRGIFAKRSINIGSSIAASSLIIFSRDFMDIQDSYRDGATGRIVHKDDVILGKQMTLNYCFSHPDSSLMIIPNSAPVLYINHNGENPNAKIQWIDTFNMKTDDWLSKSPEELLKMESGPMIEYYALRDIKADEEITLDYGPEWEAAWTKHVESWDPDEDDKNYIAASDYMEQGLFTVRTKEEQEDNPYPENLDTACYFTLYSHDDHGDNETVVEGVELDWSDYSANRILHNGAELECVYHCKILSSKKVDGTKYFDVVLFEYTNPQFKRYHDVKGQCWIPGHIFVDGLPSEAIIVIDKPYTSDEHIDEAFRHEIGVPEGFFPPNWLDISKKENRADA
jgi:hypothetical protein